MVFLGGKTRLGPKIAAILNPLRGDRKYLEPFVGSCGVTIHVNGERTASDLDGELIAMWQAAIDGWIPPSVVTEDDYIFAKIGASSPPPHLKAFVKYACSWGGKPWGGYARGNRDYARLGSVSVVNKAAKLKGVRFEQAHYASLDPYDSLIYCDPPYQGVTGYSIKFDHDAFWNTMSVWSDAARNNVVVISEYQAPEEFKAIAEFPLFNKLNRSRATEKLFMSIRAI